MSPHVGILPAGNIRIAESKHRLMPHVALMPTDSLTVDKIGALPDDRFQELLADGSIHPKMKRNDMAVHAAQESQERDLAAEGAWGVGGPEVATYGSARRVCWGESQE